MSFLRRRCPVVRIPRLAWLVTRHADVCEVLRLDQDFTVQPYAAKMEPLVGRFLMGMDGAPHEAEVKTLRSAVRKEDRDEIGLLSKTHAERRLAISDGRIDVIGDLTDPVVDATISDYFAISPPTAGTLLALARPVFHDMFLNAQGDDEVTRQAARAATDLRQYLEVASDSRLADLDAGADSTAGALDRLLLTGRHPEAASSLRERVVPNLVGLIVAWAVSVSRGMGRALDELLGRERELGEAHAAACSGDRHFVEKYLFEALRFNPQAVVVDRLCMGGAIHLSSGTRTERVIPQNAKVLAHIGSAMMDEDAPGLAEPARFRADRPWEAYLHFGHGLHSCFGEPLARAQMTTIAMALLAKKELRRAGRLELSGPFPRRLDVTFAP